jgi:hypothetical protein
MAHRTAIQPDLFASEAYRTKPESAGRSAAGKGIGDGLCVAGGGSREALPRECDAGGHPVSTSPQVSRKRVVDRSFQLFFSQQIT